jgi:hypothetical protein
MAARKLKVSTTGYKENSKDKNLDKLYVPSSNLTMTGVKKHVKATPVYPNDMYGNPITMIPGVPSYTFPGAVGVIEEKLPKAQLGLDWEALENPGLAAKAKAMGHNTIAEYRNSNWGYGDFGMKNKQQQATTNTPPVARITEPAEQEKVAYLEAKNKLRLRQEVESAQARFEGGEDIFNAIEDRDKAENALNEMYKKYPNDKRLTAKEMEVSKGLGKFMIEHGIEKGIFKGLPLLSANPKYLDIVQSLQGASNIKNVFDIQDVLDSKQRGDDKYAYYTEELKDKVDNYEKAHGTYQPGLMDKVQALMPNRQDGGGVDWEAVNNPELAAKAKAMGHNTIAEYRNSNWGYGKNIEQIPSSVVLKEAKGLEADIDKWLDHPKRKAYANADLKDNTRHSLAGMYTQQAIKDKVDIPIIGDALGFVGANAMGLGHEISTLYKDGFKDWESLYNKTIESGEDAFNNFVGSTMGLMPGTQENKKNIISNLSSGNWLPDGVVRKDGTDLYNKKQGGQLPQAQQGLPNDYEAFLKYSETAPENRRPDAEWQYGNPRQYDHYGMWDALGKPKNFDEALANYPQWQPDPGDGYYHGFSTNPNTGVWLKSHIPGEYEPGNTGWMEYKDFMLSNDPNWGGKNQNLIFDPEIQRMRYVERKKQGGSLHRMQTEGQFSNPNFKPSYDWRKSPKENAELNRRAEAAGHNSVGEYEASGWAWQPEKTHFTKGQGTGIGIIKAQPKQQTWDQQVMEGIPGYSTLPPKAKSKTTTSSSSLKADIKKMNQDLISGFAVAESTMPANMWKPPIEWEGKSIEQITAMIEAQKIEAERQRELDSRDVLTADTKSDSEKLARKAWTALSHPMETLAAVSRGYSIPYGYMGMHNPYDGLGIGSPMTSVVDLAAGIPGFLANAVYRQGEKIVDNPGEYLLTNTLGLFDPKYSDEALGNYLDLSAAIPASRAASGPLVKSAGKVYNKVATGNSRLTDFGFPAWKVERPSAPIKSTDYIARPNTDVEIGLLNKFGKGMKNLTPEEWVGMENLTRSGATDFSKGDYPISRILGYYERGSAENKLLEGLKVGDVFHTPTEKTIRTWSVGTPGTGDLSAYGNTRLVIPSRYTKGLGNNFGAMPYNDKRLPFIWNPETGGINSMAVAEKEIMGNIPKGFKVIGSSKENGIDNLIIKPLKEGGELPKAQIDGQISKEERINKETDKAAYESSAHWDPNNWNVNGVQPGPLDYDKKTGKYYEFVYDPQSSQFVRREVVLDVKPKSYGLPAKNAPKKTKEQVEKEKAIKYSQKAKNDPTLWLLEHPEWMIGPDGTPIRKTSMESEAPADYLTEQQKALKEEFIRERNAEPLQQSLGTLDNNPQTAAAATRYANTELAGPILEKNPRDKYATRAEWIESFTPQEKAIIEGSNKAYQFDPNAWTTFGRALQTEGNRNSQWQRNLDLTEEEKNRPVTKMERFGLLAPLLLPAQGVQRVLTEPFNTKNFLTGVVLNNWYNGDTPKPYYGDDGTMRDYYQPQAQAIGNGLTQAIFDPLNFTSFGVGGIGTELAGDLGKLDNPLANLYKYNPLATKLDDVAGKMVGEGKGAFIADPARNYTAYKPKPNFLTGYKEVKDASTLNWSPLIDRIKTDAQAKILENFVTLTGGKMDDLDLAQFINYYKAENNRYVTQLGLGQDLGDIYRAKIKGSIVDSKQRFRQAPQIGRDEALKLRTSLEETHLPQEGSPLGPQLGGGAEGSVYELASDPNFVIKVGQTFKTDDVADLLKSFEGIIGDNIAVVKRAHQDGSGLIEIMPNLNRTGEFKNLTKAEVLDKLEADARNLMDKGFYLDIDNLSGNFKYNTRKNVVDIYDVSKPAQGRTYQDPELVIAYLKEYFDKKIPNRPHPSYTPNSTVSKPVVQLTGAEATKRLDAAQKEFASLVGKGFENLTPDELFNLYHLEGEISTLSNSVKKLGGTAKPRDHKSLDNYFEAAWTNSRKTN